MKSDREVMKMETKNWLKVIVVSIIGGIIGYVLVVQFSSSGVSFDKALMNTASEMNKNCPMMIDKETRLDSTLGGPGKRFSYFYTLVNYGPGDIDKAKIISSLRPNIVNNAKSSEDMKLFREQDVELIYIYKANDNSEITRIVIKPDEY
ncbi:MAG: hypothetical protein GY847_23135 [Proteobacteria bacterium]|nr:hypothetical protein [Pseudomonadota bacterium]